LENTPTEPLSFSFNIKTGNVNTIFLVLGVDFLDLENPLYSSIALLQRVNASCIVAVDKGVTVPFTGVVPDEEVPDAGTLKSE
jgi:hypothetical protein